jgi:hypothetical protein
MTPEVAQLRRLLDNFKKQLRNIVVPHIWEARCAWLLESAQTNWVTAAEGAPVDGGLLISKTADAVMHKDPFQRLLTAIDHPGNSDLVPLDMKTITPIKSAAFRGDWYYYYLYIRATQRSCFAFLVQNPLAPDLVALIPQSFLDRGRASDGTYLVQTMEMSRRGEFVEYFPMTWGPFVVPTSMLARAVQSLQQYILHESEEWYVSGHFQNWHAGR